MNRSSLSIFSKGTAAIGYRKVLGSIPSWIPVDQSFSVSPKLTSHICFCGRVLARPLAD